MRGWWIGVVAVLGGCSQANPWFVVDDDSTPGPVSTDAQTDTGPGTGTGGTTDPVDTTMAPDTTDDTGMADTTGPAQPGDTTSADGTTSSTGVDATTDTTDTTGPPDTTGGEPFESEVWYDLWWRCDHTGTQWAAFGELKGELNCWNSFDEPPDQWAGRLLPGVFFMGQPEPEVLALVPIPGKDNSITGTFNGLKLAGAAKPHLRATVVCPDEPPKCDIKGNIRVEREMETIIGIEDFPLTSGKYIEIDIDLSKKPALLDGTEFTVVIVVTLQNNAVGSRGLWLYPRVVEISQ